MSEEILPQTVKLETVIDFLTNHGFGPDSNLHKDDKYAIDALLDQYEMKAREWREEENRRLEKALPVMKRCAEISVLKTSFTFGLIGRTHMKNCPCKAWMKNLGITEEREFNA